jgi:hypothetical protein
VTNKYLEKIAAFRIPGSNNVGKYLKHLTGETVRDTTKALNVRRSMNESIRASGDAYHKYTEQFKNAPWSPRSEAALTHARITNNAKEQGMSAIEHAVHAHIPRTNDADLAKAIKSRIKARVNTAIVGGTVTAGALAARAHNNYKEINQY